MSYNGSGTFNINSAGQPVVTGTVIASTPFNALTADLGTGLSTAITKDGQTTTTARIPFAAGINSSLVTDATNTATGSIITAGGVGIAKALFVGTTVNILGSTSGTATIVVSAAAGTPTLTLPTTTGTLSINGPAFSAYQSTSTAVTASTVTKVLFDVELFDTNSNFASSRFTPTVEGYYQVNARTGFSSSVLTRGQAAIRKNGVAVNTLEDTNGSAAYSSIGSALIYMNGSTDYLEIYVFIAGSTTIYDGGAALTWFQAAMVRGA